MAAEPIHPPPKADLRGIVRAAGRNLGWLLASRGLIAVLSLFYLGVATRSLGVVDFGRFALITGATQALATFVGFQTWQIIVQYGVEPMQSGDTDRLARLLRACGLLDLASAIIGAVAGVAILLVWGDAFGIPHHLMRVTMIFAVVQLVTIRSTPLGILRLRDRFSLSALADSMTPVIRFVGAGLALLFDPTINGFLIAWGVAELVTAAVYWVLIAQSGDLRLMRTVRTEPYRVAEENPGLVRFALSVNASATLGLSSKQIPLLLVGATIGPAAAGVFRLASQVAQALAKLSQLLARAAFPEIVRAVRAAEPAQLRQMMSRMFSASAVAAIVILALVAVAGQPVLLLVGGSDFGHAYPILLWLAAAGCLDLATVGVDTLLTALHRAVSVFVIRAIGAAALFAVAFALLPLFGAGAVAISVFAGSAIVAILLVGVAIGMTRSVR